MKGQIGSEIRFRSINSGVEWRTSADRVAAVATRTHTHTHTQIEREIERERENRLLTRVVDDRPTPDAIDVDPILHDAKTRSGRGTSPEARTECVCVCVCVCVCGRNQPISEPVAPFEPP